MKNITEVIDSKFDEALQMSLEGRDSIRTSSSIIGPDYEIIALDSYEASESRCILARYCLGSMPVIINGIEIVILGKEIPREEYDKRKFEDMSPDEIEGNLFVIGKQRDESIYIEGEIQPDWLSVGGLAYVLSGMRVAESNPLPIEL